MSLMAVPRSWRLSGGTAGGRRRVFRASKACWPFRGAGMGGGIVRTYEVRYLDHSPLADSAPAQRARLLQPFNLLYSM
jgi:hypothetical protein